MSHKQNMSELRQQLESWKASVDSHSSHAPAALYEFLSKLLKLGEEDETEDPATISDPHPMAAADDDPPVGGNNPNAPDIP